MTTTLRIRTPEMDVPTLVAALDQARAECDAWQATARLATENARESERQCVILRTRLNEVMMQRNHLAAELSKHVGGNRGWWGKRQ